jgi:transposase-like protein
VEDRGGAGPENLDNVISYKKGKGGPTKRRSLPSEFWGKAVGALRNDETMAELAARLGFHPSMIKDWKRS